MGANGLEYSSDITDSRNYLINDLGWTINGDSEGDCEFLSAEDFSASSFKMYPNPTAGEFTVIGLAINSTIKIFDTQGKLMFSQTAQQNQLTLDVSNFASGIYFLQVIESNGALTTKKWIKK